jgi:hypothetical protein
MTNKSWLRWANCHITLTLHCILCRSSLRWLLTCPGIQGRRSRSFAAVRGSTRGHRGCSSQLSWRRQAPVHPTQFSNLLFNYLWMLVHLSSGVAWNLRCMIPRYLLLTQNQHLAPSTQQAERSWLYTRAGSESVPVNFPETDKGWKIVR